MSSRPLLLSIDQGTQSVRAMIFDAEGQLLAKSQVHIEAYFSKQPGWAEQECDYFWQNLCKATRQLADQHPDLLTQVVGASLTTQRASVVCLDQHKQPLRPAIIWLDRRRTRQYPAPPWWLRAASRLYGGDTIRHFQSKAECNWLAADEPEIWAKTRHFVLLSGYLQYKLTGELVDAVASQVGYLPFDFKQQQWAGKSDPKWHLLQVKPEQLSELVPAGSAIGRITAEAAAQTGLPNHLVFYASGSDKACEVLGSGAVEPSAACLSYGTTATLNTCNSRYVESMPLVPAYAAAMPGYYNTEVIVQRGYWMVNWFKREFAQAEVLEAQQQGVAPESLFDDLLKQTQPGANGLILQPFWNPGVRVPGPEAKGAIIGFGDVHTRAHLYRAIVEGIGYALREGLERVQQRNGVKITKLLVSGGGSQSDDIMAMTANLFNLPVERPHTFETSGLGAAINTAVGCNLHADHATAVAAMTRSQQQFLPDPTQAALYNALYQRVYTKLYGRLSPLYKHIRDITHYPAF